MFGSFSYLLSYFFQFVANRPDVLQNAKVRVWSNSECQNSFDKENKKQKIQPTQMCAGEKVGGIDACWVSITHFLH